MESLEAFIGALRYFVDPSFVVWMLAGVIAGLIVGILPGIGGMSTLAIFLPFTFVLTPEQALPFMVAVLGTTFTGGAITAVLVGIPGDGPNITACLDGYPMTRRGEGSRALGIALMSSAIGGTISAFMALAMIPVVLALVYALASPEMVFVILLGILCVAELSAGHMTRGLISGGFGLLISFVGYVTVTGEPRFTFGSIYLYDGLPMLPLAMGLFAMPVMIDLIMHGGAIARSGTGLTGTKDMWRAARDLLHNKGIMLRSTIIGYIVGVIPGIGSQTATWVSYGQAKGTSKNAEQYGSGAVDGLVAATSSCNASLGGDLLVTLALGIPGSAAMAILLGGMMMVGLTPGPSLLKEHLTLSLGLIYIVAISHLIGAALCMFFIPQLAKVAYVPARILVALTVPLIFVGLYAASKEVNDLMVLLVATALGVAMQRFGYGRPALFLGYILGNLFEHYFFLAYQTGGAVFFLRPVSLTLIAIIVAILTFSPLKRLFTALRQKRKAA